jgi:hypothetical protein
MMNRSVSEGGPLAGQPGALENVRYITSSEFQAGGVGAQAGQDTGNKKKFATVSRGSEDSSTDTTEVQGSYWKEM